jgi:glyoxylase-like metal-dependent hydrolase (beta-lactamase superfamily II)/8-oxo-dGTP pyrophosphatase MutT (NUDIX family)
MTAPHRPRFRESSVVVLVRGHGDALETFWVLRSEAVAVQPGFRAFLGGKVDAQDLELPVEGAESEFERAARACAIREAFEEAGVLVGLAEGSSASADDPALRDDLLAGRVTCPELARARGWRFRADALIPAGRWTTPPFATARFDTCYYLARVPAGQRPRIVSGELTSGEWVRPLEALERYRRGEEIFAAPILWTLIALAEGEEGLARRLERGPERARSPVPRIELSWGVVLHPMPTKPLPPATHTNAFLIGERDMVLLDPGSGDPAAIEELGALVDHLHSEGRRLRLIALTHHHPDHTGAVEAMRRRYRVPVAAHAGVADHVKIDVALGDGERIPLEAGLRPWDLRVIHTPGHTRDHLCLYHEAGGGLFCGDHVAGTGTVVIDPPDGDMRDYLTSLERLVSMRARTLFPAHGSPQGAVERRLRGLIAHRLEREAKVLAALDPTPRALAELIPGAYADVKPDLWPWAERSLLAHLLKLEAEGRARRDGERWCRA